MKYEKVTDAIQMWSRNLGTLLDRRPANEFDLSHPVFPEGMLPLPGEESSDYDWLIMYQDWLFFHLGMQWNDEEDYARFLVSWRDEQAPGWITDDVSIIRSIPELQSLLDGITVSINHLENGFPSFILSEYHIHVLR